jgi:hypothetical protein
MVFYSRHAIHEAWLPFFTLLAIYGAFGLSHHDRRNSDVWALGLGLTGMVLTKETYIIHCVAAVTALGVGSFLDWLSPTRPAAPRPRPADLFTGRATDTLDAPLFIAGEQRRAPGRIPGLQILQVAGVCIGIIVLFYSAFGLYWKGVAGVFSTFQEMFAKGTSAEDGHHKEFFYWLKLMAWYEWPACIGLLAAPVLALRRSPFLAILTLAAASLLAGTGYIALQATPAALRTTDFLPPRLDLDLVTSLGLWLLALASGFFAASPAADVRLRWLCLYGLASLSACAMIPYKTPWCVINLLWPFFFALGRLGENLMRHVDRRLVWLVGALLAAASLSDAIRLNFRDPTSDGDRYAYVQTTFDINKLLRQVHELVRDDPLQRQMTGIVMLEPFPLSWYLNDFPNVAYLERAPIDAYFDADFLLVPDASELDVQSLLLGMYFKEHVVVRPGGSEGWLYLGYERFHRLFPGREPEFRPRVPQPVPTLRPGVVAP